ncbi:hypothetical protein A407_0103 [Listeria monocytogenes serotype 4b str. 81-0861]|nr:hypothetical protein A407_0103 [Listeria monocytogenes serotype 4b str. 81-0861]
MCKSNIIHSQSAKKCEDCYGLENTKNHNLGGRKMNNIKQAIIKLETILENGNEKENRLFVKYNTIKNILDLLEKDQELKIIEMEVELNGVEDSIENAALLEKRLSEAKSLVEDLANTINSLEIKVK